MVVDKALQRLNVAWSISNGRSLQILYLVFDGSSVGGSGRGTSNGRRGSIEFLRAGSGEEFLNKGIGTLNMNLCYF